MRGFPPFLQQFVETQIERRGIAAHFSSIRIDVFRGIVAKDAVLADAQAPAQVLARIDELQIDWNWPRLIRGRNAIDALRIANATITVPTPADEIGAEVFKAAEAHATFRFEDDGAIQIDQLTGVYAGIRLHLAGRIKPRAASLEPKPQPSESAQSPFVFITKALRELNGLHGAQPPQLDVDFDLDLGAPLDSRVTAKLYASNVNYRKLTVEKLTTDIQMIDGAIDIRDATLLVGKGELTIRGRYDISAGNFDLKLDSSLDPNLFLPSLPKEIAKVVRDFRVFEPPKISVRYVLSTATGILPVLTGSLEFGALECRKVPFRRVGFTFTNKGAELTIPTMKIVTKEGQLTGHGQYNMETSDFTYDFDSTLDPRPLLPLLPPKICEIIEPSWFEKSPHIVAKVRGDFVDPDAFEYDATLTTKRCAYRGVALNAVSAKLKVRRSMLDATDVVVERDEGEVRGWVFVNFNTERLAFDLTGTANISAMVPLLGPVPTEVMLPYRFGPSTVGAGTGLIDFKDPTNIVVHVHAVNEGFSYWKLTADKAVADITITNNILFIDNFDGDFYGGKLRGKANFALTNDGPYRFDFTTETVDVRKLLTAMSSTTNASSGKLTGEAWVTGKGSDLAQINGAGKLSINDGVLWEIPIFGIFSRIMNGIDSGLGTTKATKAVATFTLGDKSAKTEDMTVAAGAFTLTGQGKVGFDGKLDFRVDARLLKSVPLLSQILWPLSKILEYKIGGTLGDYSYRPLNLPKEILPHDSRQKPQTPDAEKPNAN